MRSVSYLSESVVHELIVPSLFLVKLAIDDLNILPIPGDFFGFDLGFFRLVSPVFQLVTVEVFTTC